MASGDLTTRTAATSPLDTDLLYLARSPFGVTDDRKITYANFKAAVGASVVVPQADGFTITAGTTPRTLTVIGGDITLSGAGGAVYTYPGVSSNVYTSATGTITSAQLAASLTDETGTGAAVFATSPTLVTPVLGVASATRLGVGVANGGTGLIEVLTTGLQGYRVEADTAARIAISAFVTGDAFTRFSVIADGTLRFGDGTAVGDTTLGRVAAGTLALAGGTGFAELRFYEPSGSGTNYTAFRSAAQGASITYILPTADGSGVLTSNGSGTLSWAAASSGTVTSASVVSANGFGGSVATATTTPAITITTSVTGLLEGDGTGVTGVGSSGTGNVVRVTSATLVTPVLGVATGTALGLGKTVSSSNVLDLLTDGTRTGGMRVEGDTSGREVMSSYVTLDANKRFTITTGGTLSWGDGSATTDTSLSRSAAGVLTTPGTFNAATAVTLGTASAQTGELSFLNATNANTLKIKAGVTSASYVLTLPTAVGAAGTVLTDAAGNGVLSWAAAGGLAWGGSISGTTDGGLSLTLSDSSDDGAAGLKITAGSTQANNPVLLNLQVGTSANVMGAMIQGTFSNTVGAVGTGESGLTIWGNTSNQNTRAISIGNGTSFTERFSVSTAGNINTTGSLIVTGSSILGTNGNLVVTNIVTQKPSGDVNAIQIQGQGIETASYLVIAKSTDDSLLADFRGRVIDASSVVTSSASLTARTISPYDLTVNRTSTRTSGTTADDFRALSIVRSATQNGAGGTLTSTGSVIYAENASTQTAGTHTNSVNVIQATQDADSTGFPIRVTQNAVVSTNFRKVLNESNAGITIWISDGTDPNGTLTGTAGDICLNGVNNKPAYNTGGTTWVNFV